MLLNCYITASLENVCVCVSGGGGGGLKCSSNRIGGPEKSSFARGGVMGKN